jgi:hypothetical protein
LCQVFRKLDGKTRKEMDMANFKAVFQHFIGGSEEIKESLYRVANFRAQNRTRTLPDTNQKTNNHIGTFDEMVMNSDTRMMTKEAVMDIIRF